MRNLLLALIGRGRKTSTLMVYFFFQRSALNVLMILSTALFLLQVGVEYFPLMYVVLNVLSILVQVTTAMKSSFSSYRLLERITLATIAFLIVCAGIFSTGIPEGDEKASLPVAVTIFLFMVGARMFEIFSSALFFNVVYDIFPLREAKLKIPGFLTAGSLGVILTGFAVKPILALVSIPKLILACSILIYFDYFLLRHVGRILRIMGVRTRGRVGGSATEDEAARKAADAIAGGGALEPGAEERDTLFEKEGAEERESPPAPPPPAEPALATLGRSPLIRTMVLITFTISFLKFLLDFQYSRSIALFIPDRDELASFLGIYESILTVVVIGVQAFVTAPVFVRFKVGTVAALLPAMMTVLSFFDAFWPGFLLVVATKFLFSVFSNGFYQPSGTILLGPLPQHLRERGRMLITAATSMGCLTVGVCLSVGLQRLTDGPYFALMALLFGISFAMALTLDDSYQQTLTDGLSATDIRHRLENLRALRVVSGDYAATWILELIRDPDPDVRQRALGEVKFLGRGPARRVLEQALRVGDDGRIRSLALKEAARVLGEDALELVRPRLDDADDRVRANALEALVAIGGPTAEDVLRRFTADPHHRLRAAAVTGLFLVAETPADLEHAATVLVSMIRDPVPIVRASAASAMGRLAFPFLLQPLVELLGDEDPRVVGLAVEGLERLRAHEAVPRIARRAEEISDPVLKERLYQACERIEDENAESLMQIMETLSAEERTRLSAAISDIRHGVRAQVLIRAMSLGSARAREAVVSYLHAATHPKAPALVQACLEREGAPTIAPALDAMRSGHYRGERAISRLLQGFMNHENSRLLKAYLREVWSRIRATVGLAGRYDDDDPAQATLGQRRRRLVAHGFVLVSLRSENPQECVELLEKALEGDRFVASMSYELLAQHMGPGYLKDLAALLDDLRDPDRMKIGPDPGSVAAEEELLLASMPVPAGSAGSPTCDRTEVVPSP